MNVLTPNVPTELHSLESLHQVVDWALRRGLDVDDVVRQDEYRLDVLVRVNEALVLSFDCT